jgi:hypothetical protein
MINSVSNRGPQLVYTAVRGSRSTSGSGKSSSRARVIVVALQVSQQEIGAAGTRGRVMPAKFGAMWRAPN